jgi:hypothetical protein
MGVRKLSNMCISCVFSCKFGVQYYEFLGRKQTFLDFASIDCRYFWYLNLKFTFIGNITLGQ